MAFPWTGKHRKKSKAACLPIAKARRWRFITRCGPAEQETSDLSSANVFRQAERPTPGWNGVRRVIRMYSIQRLTGLHVARIGWAEAPTFRCTPMQVDKNFAPRERRPFMP